MTREEERACILKEAMSNSNKPRFCYMGYAPPLCIGDEYDKPKRIFSGVKKDLHPRSMLVSFPKKGNGPESLFSFQNSLCVGDPYRNLVRSEKGQHATKDGMQFRPSGKPPDSLLGKLEYIGDPEPKNFRKATKNELKVQPPPFIASFGRSNKLFQSTVEYFSNLAVVEAKSNTTQHQGESPRPPFRVGGCFVPPPCLSLHDTTKREQEPVETVAKKSTEDKRPAFRPAGGRTNFEALVSTSCSPTTDEKPTVGSSDNRPGWKAGGSALLSSPHPSIAFNLNNLKRRLC